MRGVDVFSEQLFTVKRLDDFIPGTHPLRPVREMVNAALRRLDGLFEPSRSNDTHASTTDPDARLYRKGKTASELRYMGHTLTDNRHGLIANARVTHADGHAEREAAKAMIGDACQANPEGALTLGADKGYDAAEFVKALQEMKVVPHIAQNTSNRRSAVPNAIAASDGYAISQNKRKLIEQGFGWAKLIGRIRQVMVRGLDKVDQIFVLNMTAYNLVRMRTLGQLRLQSGKPA
ncbi:transposase [Xanthomonas citri]|uniref:transposase n=1 Tax=Xanthomonas citri TaxID=346 RepID=UPI000BB52303|nr:transposase [Xanthomonas citri]ATB57329.1 Transposase DDE domain protein [Xanthomonas citri pv. fuscans]